MANQRATFSKRNREMKLKDKARAKAERRSARQGDNRPETKGPQIAWDEAGGTQLAEIHAAPPSPVEPPADPAPAPAIPPGQRGRTP